MQFHDEAGEPVASLEFVKGAARERVQSHAQSLGDVSYR
jgi:hypothetical protein